MALLRSGFFTHIGIELQAAQVAAPVVGLQVAQSSAVQSTLVAMCFAGRPRLYQFDQQGAPEEATENLPFVCLGSGQSNADPFLAFLKGLFWEDGQLPSIPNAIFAAVWTVQQSIKISPAYLGDPIRVFVLRSDGGNCVATQLSDAELQEAPQAVDDARSVLKGWARMDQEGPQVPQK